MSQAQPGYVLNHHVPPTASPRSSTTKSSTPASRSLIAMHRPEKPEPTMATSTSAGMVSVAVSMAPFITVTYSSVTCE